jgi:Xaa-Pro aminopeptidase
MTAAPNSLVILRATSAAMESNQDGFRQNRDFLYFTGLTNAIGAALVVDTERRESWLFVPDEAQLRGGSTFALRAPYGYMERGADAAGRLGVEHLESWKEFASVIDRRLSENPALSLRAASAQRSGLELSVLLGQNQLPLWQQALQSRWPKATIQPLPDLVSLRDNKDSSEIAILRRVAASSAAALRSGLRGIRPGRRQRETETDVVAACVASGGDRVSFWPWVMSGPNSDLTKAFQSLADGKFLDRVMERGELVRVDVGCAIDEYEGDVGRSAPVAGRFSDGQREAWDLFVAAYRGGLREMRAGRSSKDVLAAWRLIFERNAASLKTDFARRTASIALSTEGTPLWQIHGVGLDNAEGLITTFRAGQVFAYEPILTVDGIGLYLEDMVLMTERGPEVLTTGLPYTASEIEREMAARR